MEVFIKKKLGTWSDISCFSFEEKKIITTGDGGMICLNDKNIKKSNIKFMDGILIPGKDIKLILIKKIYESLGI